MTFFAVMLCQICLWPIQHADAKPVLEAFTPRSIKIGIKTELTASGKFSSWPIKVWTDRPGLEFELGEKGKLSVTTSGKVAPGIYLVRFLDSTGASEPIPLIVDFADSFVEKEPNESPQQSNLVTSPVNVSGVLAKSGDVDCYQVECKKGQTLVASVRANPLWGATMDGIVQICNQRGFVLDQNDDKLGVDPRLEVKIPQDGVYFVRVFAFPAAPNSTVRFAGGADYRYLLTISNRSTFLFPQPLTDKAKGEHWSACGPNDPQNVVKKELRKSVLFYSPGSAGFFELSRSPEKAISISESNRASNTVLAVPFDFSGMISQNRQWDFIRFQGEKGKEIRLRVDARRYGFELDPVLTLFDENGKQLLNKDDNAKTDPDLVTEFTPGKDGIYFARIKDSADAGGPDYRYRLRVEPVKPDFQLIVDATSFELTAEKPLEIEVSVIRENGFNLPIEISVVGMEAEQIGKTVVSEPKGDSSKKIKLNLEAKSSFQKIVKIVGRADGQIRQASVALPSGRQLDRFVVTSIASAGAAMESKPVKQETRNN